MPRVKIDYVVSMSSEDPENPASNLLAWDVSKKKWLCNVGETTCSVVLQLARAVQIESITIGTYNTALLEVLVGSSEKPNDPYEVLVPSCVVLTPRECRGAGGARVRSVPRPALAEAARRRWDRVRLVCSQPYNRHCQYGLSFVHIFEPECAASAAPSAPSVSSDLPDPSVPSVPSVPRVPSLRLDALSSDDEEFRPGELFAKHSQEKRANTTTGAQIRQATSLALKNISDSSTKLVKTAISKTSSRENKQDSRPSDRDKTSLLYTDDEERPHEKIDRVVQRHNDQKQKGEDSKKSTVDDAKGSNRKPTGDTAGKRFSAKRQSRETGSSESKTRTEDQTPHKNATSSAPASSGGKKRKRSDDAAPLADVVFALSGYANPRRAAVRAAALRLGARYRPDVGPDCTHLICAFPNTPKLRAARAGVVVVTADWVERCEAARARLHWRSFATRPEDRVAGAEGADGPGRDMDNDTDDEIEKVRRDNKKKRALSPKDVTATSRPPTEAPPAGSGPAPGRSSPDRGPPPGDSDSDVTFVRDERVKGHVTLDTDDDTDTDDWRQLDERIDEDKMQNGDETPAAAETVKKRLAAAEEVTKQSFRQKVWRHLETNGLAMFPRPVYNRIPNFKGAPEAAAKLAELDVFKNANTVKVNPDKPQEPVRVMCLEKNKALYMPVPRLKPGFLNRIVLPEGEIKPDTLRKAVSRNGMESFGQAMTIEDSVSLDLVVMGSVAVSKEGYRIDKGKGYGDLEFGLMMHMKAIKPNTLVVTTVHDCQVFDTLPAELFGAHDVPVDIIVTPTQVIETQRMGRRPSGILWQLLSPRRLQLMPVLAQLRDIEMLAGRSCTLREGDSAGEEERARSRRQRRRTRRHKGHSEGEGNTPEGGEGKSNKRRRTRRRSTKSLGKEDKDGKEGKNEKPKRPRRPRPAIDFTVKISNISPNTRVRDMKSALYERGVKPHVMIWKGFRGFCYLHFFKPGPQKGEGDIRAANMGSVLAALAQMSVGGSGGAPDEREEKPRLLTVEPAPPRHTSSPAAAPAETEAAPASLPSFLDGLTFSLDEGLCGRQRSALRRHIVAYGGLVVQSADGAGSGHYHIGRTQRSSPEWLWKCHDTRRLLPLP